MEKNEKKGKILTVVVVTVLVLVFVFGIIYGLDTVLALEGSYPPANNIEGITAEPESNDQVVSFLNKVVIKAKNEKPKFSNSRGFEVDSDSITTDFSGKVEDTVKLISDNFCEVLDDDFESVETDFSEDFSDKFITPVVTENDIDEFSVYYKYYVCPSCGENSDEYLPSCELCGGVDPYTLNYHDEYAVSLMLKENDNVVNKNFTPRTNEEALALIKGQYEDFCKIDAKDLSIEYTDISIEYNVDRLTDQVSSIKYVKNMTVTVKVTFIGEYAKLGTGTISFGLKEINGFYFTWPTIKLNTHELVIEPGKKDNLTATLVCDDPLKYTATWKSSDENVATVDEEGYIAASKEAGEVVITASYEFNGKTYTDECVVKVRIPVESIKLKDRKETISVGETFQLVPTFSPKDSTVQTVKWYTEDENIATVDDNGLVTAKSKGIVKVYALSDDGYFKSSCEVTVNE